MKKDEITFDTEQPESQLEQHIHKTGAYIPLKKQYDRGVAPTLALGPDYKIAIGSFVIVNLLSLYILISLYNSEEGKLYYLVSLVVLIYWDFAWIGCSIINPGIAVNQDCNTCDSCKLCLQLNNIFVPIKRGRRHCKQCKICIDDYQHHCAITGNCIGKYNSVMSYFFTLGLFLWGIDMAATAPFVYYL